MKNFKDVLIRLQACYEAMEWAGDKTLQEIWETCERGDWMLWLLRRSDLFKTDHRKFTMAKWVCANQVRHLMTDKRSLNALDVAYKCAIGEANSEDLAAAADAAAAAAYAAYAAARFKMLSICAGEIRKVINWNEITFEL